MTIRLFAPFIGTLAALLPMSAIRAQEVPKPPDEFQLMLKEVERTYRAADEVDKDVIDDLRKQYDNPKPEREAAILRLVRRAYVVTPLVEQRIVREMQAAYSSQTAEAEARVLEAIHRGGALPPGAIPEDVLAERAAKAFRKFDRDGDGKLTSEEMSDALRDQLSIWDRNRDGVIDAAEYAAYFAAGLKEVAVGVASGTIPLKQAKGAPPTAVPMAPAQPPARKAAVVQVPDWFAKLDLDGDGQVGLYEWKKAGRAVDEFLAIDQNRDGFIEARELLAYMAAHPDWRPGR